MRRTNGEGYIEQRKKTNWDWITNDTEDELIFFEPKRKRSRYDASNNLPEVVGKSNGKNPKSASFKAGVKGSIKNERAI